MADYRLVSIMSMFARMVMALKRNDNRLGRADACAYGSVQKTEKRSIGFRRP
jgi:hypothetical protein